MAVGGFVCSLVGMILAVIGVCFFIGGPLAAVGLVLSIVGRNHARERGAPTGLATAGFVMGIIGVLAGLLWLVDRARPPTTATSRSTSIPPSSSLPLMLASARHRLPALRRDGGR